MKYLYFVRHGLSELNVAEKVSGHTETPLTKEGRQQAMRTGKDAKKLNIEHMISSPFRANS